MKISKHDRKKIIDGLLPQMVEKWQDRVILQKKRGEDLISAGRTTDKAGNEIDPNRNYSYQHKVPVNHSRRMGKIIDSAPTLEAMKERLAEYLVKNGKGLQKSTYKKLL